MKHFIVLLCAFLLCLVVNLCNGHGHGEEDIQRGKEKWFKQPEDHGHDHVHDHHHHDHGHDHVHDHHHHDHGHHHHDHGHHHHDHGHHDHGDHQHVHKHTHTKPAKKARTMTQTIDIWWQALFATVLISAAPFVILFAVPLESNAEAYQPLLKILLSFASGGLLGDAFLHLIPHAISPHSHGDEEDGHHHHHHDEHDHSASTTVGMWVMGGVVAFLCIEKVVRLLQGGDGHCHHHHAEEEEKKVEDKSGGEGKVEEKSGETAVKRRKKSNKDESDSGDDKAAEEEKSSEEEEEKPMKVAGYLNLAADFFHNFTDGLAIGASFLGGQKLGFITTLTILFHEVPHEIGDFAILIQSGCGKKKAMWLQLSTATGAMLGCVIGLLAENVGEATTSWILPFTAGGFIYIATVSVIPELLKDTSDLKQTIKEISAMLMGIFMMVVIAVMEH